MLLNVTLCLCVGGYLIRFMVMVVCTCIISSYRYSSIIE